MRCPVCGSLVDDGLDVCPACHANLTATRVMPRLKGTWCPSCGALVPTGSTVCPKCGMPLVAPEQAAPASRSERDGEELRHERERTTTLPRIESAIPSEPDPGVESAYGREPLPHTKVFVVAALASLLVVGGATLAITHPWDPSASDPRATTPADTSQAGFPGAITALAGQDSTGDVAATVQSADETTFEKLMAAYDELGKISERADASIEKFGELATSGSAKERSSAASEAQQISLDASNLVTTIKDIDVTTTGTYTDQRDHLATLASWLRNRADALYKAWGLSAKSADPEADATEIQAPLKGQGSSDEGSYASLFAKNYEAWKPSKR